MIDFVVNVKISLVDNITFLLGVQVICSSTWLRKNQPRYCCYYIQPHMLDEFLGSQQGSSYEFMQLVHPYVRLQRTSFLRICSLVFSEILHSNRNLETERSDRSGFSRKILFSLKWQKEPKMELLLVAVKFCYFCRK